MAKHFQILLWLFSAGAVEAQHFEFLDTDQIIKGEKPILFRQVLPTTKGTVLFAISLPSLSEADKMMIDINWSQGYPVDNKGRKAITAGRADVLKDLFELATGIKLITEGPGKIIYFVTDNNHLGFINYNYGKSAISFPPFIFPENRRQQVDIRKIWLDGKGNLFIATQYDTLFVVEDAVNVHVMNEKKGVVPTFKTGLDNDSNIIVTEGARKVKKIFLGKGIIPTCFAANNHDEGRVFIGTNKGLYNYDPASGKFANIFAPAENEKLTITHILSDANSGFTWLSSMEKGMGYYTEMFFNGTRWFPYKKQESSNPSSPIITFCRKSQQEIIVAPLDSTPALFHMETGKYEFLTDTNFKYSPNYTNDIKLDAAGNLFLIKGGRLFIAKRFNLDSTFSEVKLDSNISQVVILDVSIGKVSYDELANYEINNTVRLKYYENDLFITYAARGFGRDDNLEFASKLEGRDTNWSIVPFSILDEKLNGTYLTDLDPGNYTFHVKVRRAGEDWREPGAVLYIRISPPFWKTWWFWTSVLAGLSVITFTISTLRGRAIRKEEREKARHEKELLELEARALRAQMNPHFIFNCLNSIKALIQQDEKQRSIDYLTTFSKLIRTLFHNSDKRQISLFDELETCRLYTELEAMRLKGKLQFRFEIDPNLDLKSLMVPALIIQPFIENSIWHGIVPKGEGFIQVRVKGDEYAITCEVEDDGIGRERSKLNKPITPVIHESKGVHLSQARLDLEKKLNDSSAKIEIVDKYENNEPTGTNVVITFNLQ